MYTRCPQCSTIFRVTAVQLRAAFGEVNCGSCHTTFNALTALTDDLPELTEIVVLDPAAAAADVATERAVPEPEPEPEPADEPADSRSIGNGEFAEAETDAESRAEYEQPVPGEAESITEIDSALRFDDKLIDTVVEAEGVDADPGESGEPLYDDDTGYEEVATEVGWDGGDNGDKSVPEDAATAWSSILADVDDQDYVDEHIEPEAEASASEGDDVESIAADQSDETAEPAYDDYTGIEEILHEDEFDRPEVDEDSETVTAEPDPLEFDAPEQTWSKIFVPTNPPPAVDPAPDSADADLAEQPESAEMSSLATATANQEEWAEFLVELAQDDGDFDTAESESIEVAAEDEEEGPMFVLGTVEEVTTDDEEPAIDDAAHPDPLIDYDPEFVPPWESDTTEEDSDDATRTRPSNRYIAIAALLTLALGIQLVHYNRDSLATHPTWGPRIGAVYGALGQELYPNWSLESYRISGSEAVAGRTAPAVLDIVASVVITGDEAVGLPMVRVALRDLWSNTVASRVFSPPEYLRNADTLPSRVSPGTTLPVEISVADPGADARGYIVDICLPRRSSGLQCQLEKDPFQQ